MPITRRQFEIGIDATIETLMREVHAFLAQHRSEAYTSGELLNALGGSSTYSDLAVALTKLAELWTIETSTVGATTYYAFRKDLPELH